MPRDRPGTFTDMDRGHSFPRTHRGHDAKFPGMAITYALMQRFEELAETDPERVQLIKKARVTRVNKDGNTVTGVTYQFNSEENHAPGPRRAGNRRLCR